LVEIDFKSFFESSFGILLKIARPNTKITGPKGTADGTLGGCTVVGVVRLVV